jgi:hypothetical protein
VNEINEIKPVGEEVELPVPKAPPTPCWNLGPMRFYAQPMHPIICVGAAGGAEGALRTHEAKTGHDKLYLFGNKEQAPGSRDEVAGCGVCGLRFESRDGLWAQIEKGQAKLRSGNTQIRRKM